MSDKKMPPPSGLRAPSKISKPSSLPLKKTGSVAGSTASLASVCTNANDSSEVLTVDTEDFIIGDRVYVNGNKPGYIQFIGETQFSPGDWAGVVLDEPIGKNDGSVSGVRYFQCEPKKGVFARLHRVTRLPLSTTNGSTTPSNGLGKSTVSSLARSSLGSSPSASVKQQKVNTSRVESPSATSTRTTSTSSTTTTLSPGIRVGERVMVSATSGVKMGTLRFLGPTSFAAGNWAGVELDDPVGKNDGSVAGMRYFECRMMHGLFAPLHKISKLAGGRMGSTTVTTRVSTSAGNSPLHRRSGSHESLNSSISSASSMARPGKKTSRPSTGTASATSSALQVTLKEKEDHIEQLLKERDLERSEVVRAAAQVEETEKKLASCQYEIQKKVDENIHNQAQLRDQLESMELEKTELSLLLEDEKKKVDDLQFRLEEQEILKSEYESQCEESQKKIEELSKHLENATAMPIIKKEVEAESLAQTHKEDCERLIQKINALEETIKNLESKEFENNERLAILESDVTTKEELNLQLQLNLETRKTELNSLHQRLTEKEAEFQNVKDRQEKQLEVIDGLNMQLNKRDSLSSGLSETLQSMKLNISDLERQLKSSEERCDVMKTQKTKLEDQIKNMMAASGDNSQQLSQLNSELREKEKQLENFLHQLSSTKQELEAQKDLTQQAQEKGSSEKKILENKHFEDTQRLNETLQNKISELERMKTQLLSANSLVSELETKLAHSTQERSDLTKKLCLVEAELVGIKAQLQEARLKIQSEEEESIKGVGLLQGTLEHLQMEYDILMREKEEAVKQRKVLEDIRVKLEKDCLHLKQEKSSQDSAIADRDAQMTALRAQTDLLKSSFAKHKEELEIKLSETNLLTKSMNELHSQLEDEHSSLNTIQVALKSTESQRDQLIREIEDLKDEKTKQDAKINQLQNDIVNKTEKLSSQSSQLSLLQSEKSSLEVKLTQLEILKANLEQETLQQQKATLLSTEANEDFTKKLSTTNKKLEDEKRQLENKVVELQVNLARSQASTFADPELEEAKLEKDSLTGQIEFLNSVIVDMQRKNDELKGKIEILETADGLDDTDMNLNGIKTVVPPRLFCDICDRFDLHDTEDCPTQCSEVPHSQYHGQRNNEDRPYCSNCEIFDDHWTDHCNDNETF